MDQQDRCTGNLDGEMECGEPAIAANLNNQEPRCENHTEDSMLEYLEGNKWAINRRMFVGELRVLSGAI